MLLSLLAFGWLFSEFASKPLVTAIANLNTYNIVGFTFIQLLVHIPLVLGLLGLLWLLGMTLTYVPPVMP